MTNMQVRVRFAPSPTGPLHLGGIRTALYNFLFARKHNGTFILRIEDTDRSRFVPGAEDYIIRSLKWCGLEVDEGVEQNGPYGPYRQSERTEIYREQIRILVEREHAYYAFDTPEELERSREVFPEGQFQYNWKTRRNMKNSLSISKEESERLIEAGIPYVIRIRIPEDETVVFHDLVRGEVRIHSDNLDDKVLFKSDGFPTYHLANVVDDYLMKITHVIRGEEWLPSAPLHLLLYRFFGWESSMPQFAHLPLILKPDGNGKLSKRDGDRLGFPVFPLEWKDQASGEISRGYREDGYLPEAFINMLALLGWNPGTEQELFSLYDLVDLFSIERIGHSGSKFDPEKARWFNHQYLFAKSSSELAPYLESLLEKNKISADRDYLIHVIDLIKDRVVLTPDLWSQSWFFFSPPTVYDENMKSKVWRPETGQLLRDFASGLNALPDLNSDSLHHYFQEFTSVRQIKTGALMSPLRLLIVGSGQGPGIIEIALLLGKAEIISRINSGLLFYHQLS
ncbi:MAG: glutamate--tRNA ligase [bacterium]